MIMPSNDELAAALPAYFNIIGEAVHTGNRSDVHRAMHIIIFNYPIMPITPG